MYGGTGRDEINRDVDDISMIFNNVGPNILVFSVMECGAGAQRNHARD
jgi:hypothetical protein